MQLIRQVNLYAIKVVLYSTLTTCEILNQESVSDSKIVILLAIIKELTTKFKQEMDKYNILMKNIKSENPIFQLCYLA